MSSVRWLSWVLQHEEELIERRRLRADLRAGLVRDLGIDRLPVPRQRHEAFIRQLGLVNITDKLRAVQMAALAKQQ